MKTHIIPAIRLTFSCVLVLMVLYPLLIWAIAQFTPGKGNGEKIERYNKVVGYKLEGQHFSGDRYFRGRPSAVNYNAAGSAGSNKGPTNPAYLEEVEARIDSFLAHHPTIKRSAIPSELVTASGSGLDPDISPAAALIQVKQIAVCRKIGEEQLISLVKKHTQKPLLGMMGPERVNVLMLNLALNDLKN